MRYSGGMRDVFGREGVRQSRQVAQQDGPAIINSGDSNLNLSG